MKRLATCISSALCLLALTVAPACSDNDTSEPVSGQETPEEEGELLGSYRFDGEEYPIYSAGYSASDAYLTFIFSPLGKRPFTTSLSFALGTYFLGKEYDVTTLWHNDDYMLVYEDPVHYYSVYRPLKSGTVFVERSGEEFVIRLDVELADGTPLSLDYEGPLAPASNLAGVKRLF